MHFKNNSLLFILNKLWIVMASWGQVWIALQNKLDGAYIVYGCDVVQYIR